jgi:hypothetical protein
VKRFEALVEAVSRGGVVAIVQPSWFRSTPSFATESAALRTAGLTVATRVEYIGAGTLDQLEQALELLRHHDPQGSAPARERTDRVNGGPRADPMNIALQRGSQWANFTSSYRDLGGADAEIRRLVATAPQRLREADSIQSTSPGSLCQIICPKQQLLP